MLILVILQRIMGTIPHNHPENVKKLTYMYSSDSKFLLCSSKWHDLLKADISRLILRSGWSNLAHVWMTGLWKAYFVSLDVLTASPPLSVKTIKYFHQTLMKSPTPDDVFYCVCRQRRGYRFRLHLKAFCCRVEILKVNSCVLHFPFH